MLTSRLAIAAALLLVPTHALAASSEWHHVEGGSVRIVTSGVPDGDGVLRGALEVRLKPGWKTYWRDPGSSGVPPSLEITAGDEAAMVDIAFPAPMRFDDGYAIWAGYDGSVALGLTLHLPPGADASTRIQANAFLGVCETICIPVQAELAIDLDGGADDAEYKEAVAAAFAALPEPSRPDFGAVTEQVESDAIVVDTLLPQDVEALDLFVAGNDRIVLGVPALLDDASTSARFSIPVLYGIEASAGASLPYTLVTSAGAVSGTLTLP